MQLNYQLNQCCGSGMFIPDPDFYPSRIPDPKTATKEKSEKKFVVIPFLVATNFTKFIFAMLKKKIWASFQRIIELFTQKFVTKLSTEIREPEKPILDSGSGSRGQKGTGSRIRNIELNRFSWSRLKKPRS
jgi:hypothetical protein